jgi:hypothetical protein
LFVGGSALARLTVHRVFPRRRVLRWRLLRVQPLDGGGEGVDQADGAVVQPGGLGIGGGLGFAGAAEAGHGGVVQGDGLAGEHDLEGVGGGEGIEHDEGGGVAGLGLGGGQAVAGAHRVVEVEGDFLHQAVFQAGQGLGRHGGTWGGCGWRVGHGASPGGKRSHSNMKPLGMQGIFC